MTDFQRDMEVIIQNVGIANNGTIRFVFRYPSRLEGEVDELELGTRASNTLKRAGIFKIQDIGKKWNRLDVRGSGVKTIKEIKNKYLAYYYDKLDDEERKDFWRDTVAETEDMAR